jgi:hypothetical protein
MQTVRLSDSCRHAARHLKIGFSNSKIILIKFAQIREHSPVYGV